MEKPYSQACVNNRDPILDAIRPHLSRRKDVLEIGSGTGQHAVYFSEHLNHLQWQTSDLKPNHLGILQWIEDSQLANVLPPMALDVTQPPVLPTIYDAVYTANTFHIMSQSMVEACVKLLPTWLNQDGLLIVYGPFKYEGQFTTESNQEFDEWLKSNNPQQGIRDFEWVDSQLKQQGFSLVSDTAMPANNQLIIWQRNQ